MRNENTKYKRMLVYLYETFNGDYTKIMQELFEKKIDASEKVVNKYIKDNNLLLSNYIAFFEQSFPNKYKDCLNPILIICKSDRIENLLDKQVKPIGITVKTLLDEMELDYVINKRQLKKILDVNNYQVDTL